MKGEVKVYMAGTITYYYNKQQYEKAIKWRLDLAQQLLDINAEQGRNHFDWFDPTVNFTKNIKTATDETIIKQNNFYLNQSDIMVVNLDMLHESPGTIYEIIYFYLQGKPIIAFGYNKLIHSPHINVGITELFSNIEDVAGYLKGYYIQ